MEDKWTIRKGQLHPSAQTTNNQNFTWFIQKTFLVNDLKVVMFVLNLYLTSMFIFNNGRQQWSLPMPFSGRPGHPKSRIDWKVDRTIYDPCPELSEQSTLTRKINYNSEVKRIIWNIKWKSSKLFEETNYNHGRKDQLQPRREATNTTEFFVNHFKDVLAGNICSYSQNSEMIHSTNHPQKPLELEWIRIHIGTIQIIRINKGPSIEGVTHKHLWRSGRSIYDAG